MTDKIDKDSVTQTESPDFLPAPKKGKGVRRLNRVPLIAVGLIIALVFAGIVYTFFERQAINKRGSSKGPQPPISTPSAPPVSIKDHTKPEPPPPGETPTATPTDTPSTSPSAANGVPTDSGYQQGGAAPVEMSEALQNRLRVIARIEEKRLSDWEAALGSASTVRGFVNSSNESKDDDGSANNPYAAMQAAIAASSGQGQLGSSNQPGVGGGSQQSPMAAENQQMQKMAFLSGSADAENYLQNQRKAAISPSQEVKAGTIIPGVMISGINSDLPGQIIAQVRETVYDSTTGQTPLIPSGARLIGNYDSNVTLGQSRALVGWNRIIYPDGSSINLDKMPGADIAGYAGFNDKVNNHYGRIFGHGLLLSVFSAGIQLSQPQSGPGDNYNSSQVVAGSIGQQMGQLGMQMAQRNMNIQPTLEIRPGYQFNVMITKDIILPPWAGHPLAQ